MSMGTEIEQIDIGQTDLTEKEPVIGVEQRIFHRHKSLHRLSTPILERELDVPQRGALVDAVQRSDSHHEIRDEGEWHVSLNVVHGVHGLRRHRHLMRPLNVLRGRG